MTLDFAKNHKLGIRDSKTTFTLANGSFSDSIGHVRIICGLYNDRTSLSHRDFHVFSTALHPLILGGPFLHETKVLKMPRVDSSRKFLSSDTKNTARLVGAMPDKYLRSYFHIQINYNCVIINTLAVPDIGACINSMSLAYAQSMGFAIESSHRHQYHIQLTDQSLTQAKGIVDLLVWPNDCSRSPQYFKCRFVILDGLPFDISLGNIFINKYGVLSRNLDRLKWRYSAEKSLGLYMLKNWKNRCTRIFLKISDQLYDANQRAASHGHPKPPEDPTRNMISAAAERHGVQTQIVTIASNQAKETSGGAEMEKVEKSAVLKKIKETGERIEVKKVGNATIPKVAEEADKRSKENRVGDDVVHMLERRQTVA